MHGSVHGSVSVCGASAQRDDLLLQFSMMSLPFRKKRARCYAPLALMRRRCVPGVAGRADELRGLRARRRIDAVGMLRQTFRKRMTDVR